MIVLDASALLAYMFSEPGRPQVEAELGSSCLSTVNLAEVLGRFVRHGQGSQPVLRQVLASPIEIVPFSDTEAALAASLLPHTQPLGLSLADRACLALALRRGIPVLTADRTWAALNVGVSVQVIR
jgi:PIN domain nuclease of toxin-antitoxin system